MSSSVDSRDLEYKGEDTLSETEDKQSPHESAREAEIVKEALQYLSQLEDAERRVGFFTAEEMLARSKKLAASLGQAKQHEENDGVISEEEKHHLEKEAAAIIFAGQMMMLISEVNNITESKAEALPIDSWLAKIASARATFPLPFVWGLNIASPIPSDEVDAVIAALKNSAVVYLRFNQALSDPQAKQLMENLPSMPRLSFLLFDGKNLSAPILTACAEKTAAQMTRHQLDRAEMLQSSSPLVANLTVLINNAPLYMQRMNIETRLHRFNVLSDPRYKKAFPRFSCPETIHPDKYYTNQDYRRLIDSFHGKNDITPIQFYISSSSYFGPIDDSRFSNLFNTALTSGTNVDHVNLINHSFSHEKPIPRHLLIWLLKALKTNKTLQKVELSHIDCNRDAELLAEALRHNTTLKTLELSNCTLNEEHIISILDALADNPQTALTFLKLSSIRNSENRCIGDGIRNGVRNLLLKNKTLSRLDLIENGLTDKTCYPIAASLVRNTTLQVLALSGNDFNDDGLRIMSHAIAENKNSSLQHLYMNSWYRTKYTAQGIEEALISLRANHCLENIALAEHPTKESKEVQQFVASRTNFSAYRFFSQATIILFSAKRQNHKKLASLADDLLQQVLSFLYPSKESDPAIMREGVSLIKKKLTTDPQATSFTAKNKEGKMVTLSIFKPLRHAAAVPPRVAKAKESKLLP